MINIKSQHSNWKGYGDIGSIYFNSIKKGAMVRNLSFGVNIKDIWDLFVLQDCKCFYSGEPLIFSGRDCRKKICFQTASLDRIDSSKGYVIDNLQWVHKDVNQMKIYFAETLFFKYISNIVYYHNFKDVILKNCSDYISHKNKFSPKWRGVGEIDSLYLRTIKKTALSRNLSMNIDNYYLWDLFVKQKGLCNLSGEKLDFRKYLYSKNHKEVYFKGTASLDRIDSVKGYEKGNVQWVHKDINEMKWDLKQCRFLDLCFKIYNNKNLWSYNVFT